MNKKDLDALSLKIIDKLIVYKKIELAQKNIWMKEVKELIIKNSSLYTKEMHNKINDTIPKSDFSHGFEMMVHIFKVSSIPYRVKIEAKQKTIDEVFSEYSEQEKIDQVLSWCKNVPRKLPAPFVDFIKKQPDHIKQKARVFIKNKKKRHQYKAA